MSVAMDCSQAVVDIHCSALACQYNSSNHPLSLMLDLVNINLLTPNVNYSGRTAPLTSKVAFYIFIQQIYVLNILKMVYSLRFFLFKMQFVS